MTSASTDRRMGLTSDKGMKAPVRAATTANIVLSGLQTVDGVVLASDDDVLVKNQTNPVENGIWMASTAAWTRRFDSNGTHDLVRGTIVLVTEGSQEGSFWEIVTDNPIYPGLTSISWALSLTASMAMFSFIQTGAGAVTRTALSKMRDIINAFDYGAVGDGSDNTTALQTGIDALTTGQTLVISAGTYLVTTMLTMTVENTHLLLEGGATINYDTANYSAIKITADKCSIRGGHQGGFVGVGGCASWDGTNAAPTYGVIWVTGDKVTISTRLYNIRRCGVWFKDVEDAKLEGCWLEGNYPTASWTGVETGHWNVLFDPSVSDSRGNFSMINCVSKTGVQGCMIANYGAGQVAQGVNIVGNIFESCWNHGVYTNFSNGAAITGNTFNRCQIPVVVSGDTNVISGNTMYTHESTLGDQRDIIGISVRDGSRNVVTGNTLKGTLGTLGVGANTVAIIVQDLIGVSNIDDNIISNNSIYCTDGLTVAIRLSGATKTCNRNVISGNTIYCEGKSGEGVIGVYGPNAYKAEINAITKAATGVFTTIAAHNLSVNDVILISLVTGMTQVNTIYKVASTPLATTFTCKNYLTGVTLDTSGFGGYVSGGYVKNVALLNSGNKVMGNVITVTSESYGIYGLYQRYMTCFGNSINYAFNGAGATDVVSVALFDCDNCSVVHNESQVDVTYGVNLTVFGMREYVVCANNYTAHNIDSVSRLLGAVWQPIESLTGSGLVLDQEYDSIPSIDCAVGSMWRNTSGSYNTTMYMKQTSVLTGWHAMASAPIDDTAAHLADKTNAINTLDKFNGKMVWDLTNTRMMRAMGSGATDTWKTLDNGVTVTPA
jgi:hypothetical protein